MWVRTDVLAELEKEPARPFDLTPLMTTTRKQGDCVARMTESLRLIVADIIELGKRQHAEWAEQNAVDFILLMLVGQGAASITKAQDDNLIWCANPPLIDGYQMGGGSGKPKLLVDAALKGTVKAMTSLVECEIGCKVPKRIIALIQHELIGDAVAYKDCKGRLAWKASAELVRDLETDVVA
jgi:hypothetical protein